MRFPLYLLPVAQRGSSYPYRQRPTTKDLRPQTPRPQTRRHAPRHLTRPKTGPTDKIHRIDFAAMPRNYPASVPFRTASEANRLKLAAAKASKTVPKLTPIRPHHKRDFGRFRDDAAKQGRRAFRTPIRGCDIFRNARAACRFFDLPKKTPRGTSATLNLALQDRRGPRPAAQNVAQKAAQFANPASVPSKMKRTKR